MKHLIIGAGPIGRNAAKALLNLGDSVTVATRSGTSMPGARSMSLDARNPELLKPAASGQDTIIVATNPPYPAWKKDWPPLIDSVITAAQSSGSNVVLMGNLYALDPTSGPMTESSPLLPRESKGEVRKAIWERLLAEQKRGTMRVAEVRASDYFGPGADSSAHLGDMFFKPLLASKNAYGVGKQEIPHAWAYLPDIGATIAAVSRRDDTWGTAWLVPHATQDDRATLAGKVNGLAGTSGTARAVPQWALSVMSWFSPMTREILKSSYQFREPFLVDSSRSERALGLAATPLEEALEATIESYQSAAKANI